MFTEIAFVVCPVKDVAASRAFYETILGLKVTKQWDNDWVEYDIGPGTLAITKEDSEHRSSLHGPSIGIEVSNFEEILSCFKDNNIIIHDGPWDSPVCFGCVIKDPDGNEFIIHKRKEPI